MSAILSGWYEGKAYRVISKRRKKLVDGKTYRVVELKLLHDPKTYEREDFYEWAVGDTHVNDNRMFMPIAKFNKLFKIDNNLWLIYGKEES